MKIAAVRTGVVSIALREPTAFAKTVVTAREYVIVWIETSDGPTGVGFTVGGRMEGDGRLIGTSITTILEPLILGADVHRVEHLWNRMFESAILLGRRGAVLRGMSAIDIALWDAIAKQAGQPLHRLLGGFRDAVPAYASGGYYREGKSLDGLAAEMDRYVTKGFTAVKMKVGRLSPAEDAERVRVAREAIGPDVLLALDANNAWPDAASAIRAIRRFEPFDPSRRRWIGM